jgi:hypothetical protein
MNLSQLKGLFARAACTRLYAKPLAENDNSKNQVYFGPDFEALNLFPTERIDADSSSKSGIFKAKLRFAWLLSSGNNSEAPGAQLILYPQYPEVRFSGFLLHCKAAPSELMARRLPGRVLFLGVTADQRVLGYVVGADSEIAADFRAVGYAVTAGVFVQIGLPTTPALSDSRPRLIEELGRVHRLGWINSKQLAEDGSVRPCQAPQCGGFTLEAELGIAKNSRTEPDFLGWEVKQHGVTSFVRPDSGSAITLMTPEPTGGFYKERGAEAFVRKFGYPDKNDRPDRLNFGGIHRVGERQASTGLTMQLAGYDAAKGRITNAAGAIELVSDAGEVAAAWPFAGLLAHWSRKHTRAVYVPSMRRLEPHWQYAYGARVRLAQRTDSLRFLAAMAAGAVYYDPGIKLEHASTDAAVKRRNQFRVASKQIGALYQVVEPVEV